MAEDEDRYLDVMFGEGDPVKVLRSRLKESRKRVAKLEAALREAQGEAYLGALAGDDTPDPLAACKSVMEICAKALDREASR